MKALALIVALLWSAPLFATDPTSNTCGTPASSASGSDPYTTSFSVTTNIGDTLLWVGVGHRVLTQDVASVVFAGTDNLTLDKKEFGTTMGVEHWSIANPTVTTGNVVVTYANGGTYVWDAVCAMTFATVTKPAEDADSFTSAGSSTSAISLTSSSDNAIFIDVVACNCGGLTMTAETNRVQRMDYGPATATVSTVITMTPAGSDTMPWTGIAGAAVSEAGVVYPPPSAGLFQSFVGPNRGLVGTGR